MVSGSFAQASEVLLVEDDLDDTYFFMRALKAAFPALALAAVESAEAATRYLSATREGSLSVPSAIFVDLKLPGRSGDELLQWIATEPHLAATKVIVLSASVPEPKRRQTHSGRHLVYLPKPLTSAAVAATLG
jgi:CheY-like chemotaxis protein